jgi:hypothetical protein
VNRDELALDAMRIEQAAGVTRVFRSDASRGTEHVERAKTHVAQVTDRGGHHI